MMEMGAYGPGDPRILGSTAFMCDLCMATGWSAEPCPFHAHKTWAEWLTEALRQWAYILLRSRFTGYSPDHERWPR